MTDVPEPALQEHSKWLQSKGTEGERLVLRKASLRQANLREVKLSWAVLSEADLSEADLRGADLTGADLTGACLAGANLSAANLLCATLSRADLHVANLSGARLLAAKLPSAKLSGANLLEADLGSADLSGTDLSGADLTGCRLAEARLENAILHNVCGLHLDFTFIRGAQFSALGSGWWAMLRSSVLVPLNRRCSKRGWRWLAYRLGDRKVHRDRWSVLRQTYAGPRAFYLFFFVILFSLPYIGRAALYSAVGPVEQKLVDWADARKKELRRELETGSQAGETTQTVKMKVPNETVTVAVEGKTVSVVFPQKHIEFPVSIGENRRSAAKKELEALEALEQRIEARPLWQVVLRWDEGRLLPTALAILLIVYNVGVYWLVTSVGPLRDEEERSGWSPRWADYRTLVWCHRVVTVLFFVSVFSFVRNVSETLQHPVSVYLPVSHEGAVQQGNPAAQTV